MQKRALSISTGLHVAIFVIASISMPWLRRDFDMPKPISVEFAEISAITQTNKVAAQPAPKEEKKEEKPPEDRPPPAAHNSSNEVVTPVKKDIAPDKNQNLKKDEKVIDKDAPLEKKKKKDDKKKVAKEEKPKDFSSVLKNLALDEKKTPIKSDQPDITKDDAAQPEGENAPLGEKLTMSEEDALRYQLQKCWNVPFGAKDAENLAIEIFMVINADRTLKEARVVDTSRYNSDTFFRAAADSALRAVRNPLCSPFDVPPDKYDTWKNVTVTFNPREMF